MHTFVYEHPGFGFDGVVVGEDAVLGEVGDGYEPTRDWFVEERLMIAARATGAAERALRTATDWAVGREQFERPIIEFQLGQAMIADSVVDIATNPRARASGRGRGRPRPAAQGPAGNGAAVKLAAAEAAGRVIDCAVQILGGRGYMRANRCERL